MEENYIKNYFQKKEHDLKSILKIDNLEKDKEITDIKREINKLIRELDEKGNELSDKIAKVYSSKYVPVSDNIVIHYSSSTYYGGNAYFNLDNGLAINENVDEKENTIYKVNTKRGEINVVVGYDYDLASIILRKYKYNIVKDNSRITTKVISETAMSFLEDKMATIYFEENANNLEQGQIVEGETSYYSTYDLENVKNPEFVNTLFGVNYEGEYNLKELRSMYAHNKSFEIILKTSPKEITDLLLNLDNVDKALPIHKLIGISLESYNMALEKGIIEYVVRGRNYINNTLDEKFKVNKTEKEWLDFIEEVKNYEIDLDFYNINYGSYYYDDSQSLFGLLYNSYVEQEVLREYYSLGKLTNYVVNETINQGYERVRDFIEELTDYLKMCKHEEIKPTLYSSYLRQTHDIAKRNHKIIVEKENEEMFKNRYKDFKTYVGKKYKVFAPKCSDDLKKEGDNLNHCVASYIKRVIDGDCLIYFLRREKEESLITFEVRNNTIMQVKGLHNRKPTKDEVSALQEFARCREMKVNF